MVGSKINASDGQPIFTSSLRDRSLGWRNSDIFFKCDQFVISKPLAINDTYLHCFILRYTRGIYDYWDLDNVIQSGIPDFIPLDFGKVTIGDDSAKGMFSELILFDKGLSNDALENIKNYLKGYYSFGQKLKPKVVSQSLLDNLR